MKVSHRETLEGRVTIATYEIDGQPACSTFEGHNWSPSEIEEELKARRKVFAAKVIREKLNKD